MKRNTVKAFTLVEMLIVIVIIGILIASLMPRMQTAQGRARDVARKNDLSQIQTAIITSQSDRGERPQATAAKAGTPVSTAKQELLNA
jgi:prepilin-type N-terminal cleavage/methylation domain-containing protein